MIYMRRTAGYTWTDYKTNIQIAKGVKNNTNSGQTTGIQEELDTTCNQNASQQITQGNETLFPKWQKESWQTFEETSRYVRPERVNKWPNSMTDV
jgi:calcineurin-like phosphoesterase